MVSCKTVWYWILFGRNGRRGHLHWRSNCALPFWKDGYLSRKRIGGTNRSWTDNPGSLFISCLDGIPASAWWKARRMPFWRNGCRTLPERPKSMECTFESLCHPRIFPAANDWKGWMRKSHVLCFAWDTVPGRLPKPFKIAVPKHRYLSSQEIWKLTPKAFFRQHNGNSEVWVAEDKSLSCFVL